MALAETRPLAPERDFRGPGCTAECKLVHALVPGQFGRSEILLHDAASHEAFGYAMGSAGRQCTLDVATGTLVVRLGAGEVYVEGVECGLTPTEYNILRVLAERVGQLVSHREILADVWPEWSQDPGRRYSQSSPDAHLIRVNIARLRGKLGSARGMVTTRSGMGLLLERRPYTGPEL